MHAAPTRSFIESEAKACVTRHRYRADIDGLRALAIVPVVAYHAFPNLIPGGFIGVDIFFVISGYLISQIVIADVHDGSFSSWDFYGRRIRRIFPALLLVMTLTLVFGSFVLFSSEFQELSGHIMASALFVQNFALVSEAGYFDRASEVKPLLHLWSLSVEEQFYIVLPAVILIVVRLRHGSRIGIMLAVLCIASFSMNVVAMKSDPVGAFFFPHLRGWELLVGALVAVNVRSLPENGWIREMAALVGIGLIISAMFSISGDSDLPKWFALPPVIGAALLIAAGPHTFVGGVLLSQKLFVAIGLISYPLYLWHWPILVYLRIFEGRLPSVEARMVAVAVSVTFALATYQYIEKPIKSLAAGRLAKNKVTYALCAAMLILALAGGVGFSGLGEWLRPKTLTSNNENFSWVGRFENDRCRVRFPDIPSRFCSLATDGRPNVALLGDSHAMALYTGLAPILAKRGDNLLNIGGYSCLPAANAPFHSSGLKLENQECLHTVNESIDMVVNEPAISTVVLAGRRFAIDLTNSERAAAVTAFVNTFDRLRKANKKVVYVLDYPQQALDPQACLRSALWGIRNRECAVSRVSVEHARQSQVDVISEASRLFDNVAIFDPLNYLCTQDDCNSLEGLQSLYLDVDHLSKSGSERLAIPLATELRRQVQLD